MKEKVIRFQDMNNARLFVAKAGKCDFDIDVHYNHLVFDGKSVMGLLNLDLSKSVKVQYSGENAEFEEFLRTLEIHE